MVENRQKRGKTLSIRIYSFDPSLSNFPSARIPILPSISRKSLAFNNDNSCNSLFASQDAIHFIRGRYALLEAYRASGVGNEGALLVPSYHCRTMLDPAFRLGATVIPYGLTENLAPDLESIREAVRCRCDPSPCALLLPHYFGFPQQLSNVVSLCNELGLRLIEDCSHAYVGETDLGPVGSVGDFSVASPYKFFACTEGGILRSKEPLDIRIQPSRARSLKDETRILMASIKAMFAGTASKDDPSLSVGQLANELLKLGKLAVMQPREGVLEGGVISPHYQVFEESMSSAFVARWLVKHSDISRIITLRRANYQKWLAALREMENCRPLFADLPESVTPYMFPCYIDHPEKAFNLLKRLGFPLWRWDEMMVSKCQVSQDLRMHLVHLPCHQSLTHSDMDWLVAAFSAAMAE